jgi:ABC-type uncharacterized transport system ATPase subunit
VVKTNFVGFLPEEDCLMFEGTLNDTTMFLFPMIVLLSLEGVFGMIRFP